MILSQDMNMNYDSISEIFAKWEGITIEKYVISKRLKKLKELLVYTDFSLTEVAHMTGFNNIIIFHVSLKSLSDCPYPILKTFGKRKK